MDCCYLHISIICSMRGTATFSSSQELLVVPEVRSTLLDAWEIDAGMRVGEFSREQNAYVWTSHRVNVFKHTLLNEAGRAAERSRRRQGHGRRP